jgi:HD-GYP domain-containing protein (c-di-GMP phosphodiesterase class II)
VATDVLGDPSEEHDWPALIEREPSLQRHLTEDELDAALEAIADFTDLRSASRSGHSRGVTDLAGRAATELGLPTTDVSAIRRAAMLHDVGMHGVPANILDKAKPLSAPEAERLRMHP